MAMAKMAKHMGDQIFVLIGKIDDLGNIGDIIWEKYHYGTWEIKKQKRGWPPCRS
jgi:hypothetical protein